MKKKLIAIIALAAVLLGGVAVLALGGSLSDPLISLEYLTGTFKPPLMTRVEQQVDAAYANAYQAAEAKLEAAAQAAQNQLGTAADGRNYRHYFSVQKYSLEDAVTLGSGSGLLLLEGAATAKAVGGDVIDLTAGTAGPDMTLTAGHRYLAGEAAAVTVTIRSDAASVALVGYYQTKTSGKEAMPFTDAPKDAWYYESVRFVYQNSLFNGVSEDHFAPGDRITRAMLATVLHRLAEEPAAGEGGAGFTDVAAGTWYEGGIRWCASSGIINGMGGGIFAPNTHVSREQLATMLYRYAGLYLSMDTEEAGALDRFSDQTSVSDWAEQGLSWAVGAGILNGNTDGKLNPGGSASRAETATMIQRFSKLIS